MAKKVQNNTRAGMGLAALAAGAAAAAAGYYFYASENAPKNRKIASKWAGDMKRDVIREAKKLQKIDKAAVVRLVDQASQAYAKNGPKIDKAALLKAASELKRHWDELRNEAGDAIRPAKKAAKKAAKKITRSAKKKAD